MRIRVSAAVISRASPAPGRGACHAAEDFLEVAVSARAEASAAAAAFARAEVFDRCVSYAYGRYGSRKCTTNESASITRDAYSAARQREGAAPMISISFTNIVSQAPSPLSSRVVLVPRFAVPVP